MSRKYTVLIEKDEEGWLISEVVELPGCHTQAKDLNGLMERTREAIKAYLKSSEEPKLPKNLSACSNWRSDRGKAAAADWQRVGRNRF